MKTDNKPIDPATLVAILVAARKVGNRELEREMRNRLEDEHRVRLTFLREPRGAVRHAN